MEMREIMGRELGRIMETDQRVCVLAGDLARATGVGHLLETYPDRAFNAGIAEANMTSVAAGMASCGFIPFIISFAPFVSRRNCDQVMLSVGYAKQNVKIVGTDPGITAETNGGTHMPFEDVAVLRSIPSLVIVEVSDEEQLRQAIPAIINYDGPVYLRTARRAQPEVYTSDYKFDLMKAPILRTGTDVTILASGLLLKKSLDAAKALETEGISAEVINVHTIKPLDQNTILSSVKKTGCVVTAENHNVIGGLYSAVCELLSGKMPVHIECVGVNDEFGEVGSLDTLAERYHLTAAAIVEKAEYAVKFKHKGEEF